jgi:hypothetical protein
MVNDEWDSREDTISAGAGLLSCAVLSLKIVNRESSIVNGGEQIQKSKLKSKNALRYNSLFA